MPRYQDHPAFTQPQSSVTKLWRYMDFTKFLDLLERRSLFFCRSDRFDDPFEGSVSPLNAPTLQNAIRPFFSRDGKDPLLVQQLLDNMTTTNTTMRQLLRPWTYLNCWHKNEYESAAMWKIYTRTEDSIAIQSTLGDLKKAFSVGDDRPVFIGNVSYLDYDQQRVPDDNGLSPYLHKRLSFQHEHEIRALTQGMIQFNDGKIADNPHPGEALPIDLESLVKAVYISPTCAGWFAELVERVVKKYGLAVPVHRSALGKDPIF